MRVSGFSQSWQSVAGQAKSSEQDAGHARPVFQLTARPESSSPLSLHCPSGESCTASCLPLLRSEEGELALDF